MVESADAEQVVGIHHDSVDGNTFPHGEVASLAPIHVGEAAFGSCAVGMHDVAVVLIAAQQVGDDLAESIGVETLVDILDGVVNVLLGSGNTALVVLVHFSN